MTSLSTYRQIASARGPTSPEKVRFGKFEIASTEASRHAGYLNGLYWAWGVHPHWKHVPGGPFVYTDRTTGRDDPDWQAFCRQSETNQAVWIEGWRRARADVTEGRVQPGTDH